MDPNDRLRLGKMTHPVADSSTEVQLPSPSSEQSCSSPSPPADRRVASHCLHSG